MKPNRLLSIITVLVLCIATQAQQPISQITREEKQASVSEKIDVSTLLAAAGNNSRRAFSLMPSSRAANIGGLPFNVTPMAAGPNLTVMGGGTLGRLTKWTGFTSSNSFIGDSTIFEDKFGKVGIGTDMPTSKLTVAGTIESTSGGVKFPDGSVQTTAGVGRNDVVRSLNGLKGDLTLAGDANITVTQAGNTITVAAPNVLTAVAHDNTLSGNGTAASPLSVVQSESLIEPISSSIALQIDPGVFARDVLLYTVPIGKRLVIEHVSADCSLPTGQDLLNFSISSSPSGGFRLPHTLVAVHVGDDSTLGRAYAASTPMKLYGHSGTEITVFVRRNSTSGTSTCHFAISGFLVDLP